MIWLSRTVCRLIGHRVVSTYHDYTPTNPQGSEIKSCSRCWQYAPGIKSIPKGVAPLPIDPDLNEAREMSKGWLDAVASYPLFEKQILAAIKRGRALATTPARNTSQIGEG